MGRLPCNQTTGFLRDTLCLSLLELHKYYIKEKERLGGLTPLDETHRPVLDHENSPGDVHKYDDTWKECEDGERFMTVNRNIQDLQNEFGELNVLFNSIIKKSYMVLLVRVV